MDPPWNSMELHGHSMELHGTLWNSMELHRHSMEFHGHAMETPWSSMESHGLHGTLWNSMELHGIPWGYCTRDINIEKTKCDFKMGVINYQILNSTQFY